MQLLRQAAIGLLDFLLGNVPLDPILSPFRWEASGRCGPGAAKARRDAHGARRARFLAGCWKLIVGRLKFTDGCTCRPFVCARTHKLSLLSVLGAAVARAFALELAVRLLSVLAFSKAMTCASVRIKPSCATLASKAFSRFFIVSRSWRCQTPRTPAAEIEWPSFSTRHMSSIVRDRRGVRQAQIRGASAVPANRAADSWRA
jgi:hypothetical protein